MVIMNITLDTQIVDLHDIHALMKNGQLLHIVGIVNTQWEDYSALSVAEQAGLDNVEWDYVADDTAGTLELTVLYPQCSIEQLETLLHTLRGVDSVDLYDGLLGHGDDRTPLY